MFNPFFDNEKETLEYNGFYRGIVVDDNDVQKQAGRIKVRIYPMFEGVGDEELPWAIPADPNFGGTANVGSINIPNINSHVFVFFENGDFRHPVYFAAAPAIENDSPDIPTLSREDDGTVASIDAAASKGVSDAFGGTWDEPDSAYAAVYPNNRVYRSKKGILVEIDDTEEQVRLHIYHPSGTRTEIDNVGNEVHHVKATRTTVVLGDDNIEVKKSFNITTGEKYGVNIGTDGKVKVGNGYTIETGANCTLTVGGNANISATGNVVVSGALILLN